MNSTV